MWKSWGIRFDRISLTWLLFKGYLLDGAIPDGRWWRFLYATLFNLANLCVCLIGAAAFARMSAVILGVVVVCLSVTVVSYMAQPPMDVSLSLWVNPIGSHRQDC